MSNLKHAVMNMEIGKTKYDQTMKELLSDRQVLTWILKRFVPEYQNCELEDIEKKYSCKPLGTYSMILSSTGSVSSRSFHVYPL